MKVTYIRETNYTQTSHWQGSEAPFSMSAQSHPHHPLHKVCNIFCKVPALAFWFLGLAAGFKAWSPVWYTDIPHLEDWLGVTQRQTFHLNLGQTSKATELHFCALHTQSGNHPAKRILAGHHRQISPSSQLHTTKLDSHCQKKLFKKGKKSTILSFTYFCILIFNVWTTEH